MSPRVSSPELIGRAPEMARLRDALRAVAAGSAATVLAGGEAGIGKSRLLEEFGREARAAGAVVLEGACVSLGDDDGLPFAPIAEALRVLTRELDADVLRAVTGGPASQLGRLVPGLGAEAGDSGEAGGRPEWARTRVFEELLGVLGRLGERSPVVLAIEDLHWADRSTRDVIAFIARNARTERILVLGTYRADELHRRHPLRPWLAEMDRATRVERFELRRLDRAELERQLEAILGTRPAAGLLDAVLRRSEGNPFFAEEILAAGGADAEDLPESLRDVLLARLSSLSDGAQSALGVAAVGGRVVAHDLLAAVADGGAEALHEGLREAVARQVLVPSAVDGADAYAFRHALLQEAVYDDLLPTDRRRLHAAYAEALAALPVPPGGQAAVHFAALAHHAAAAHDLPRALEGWVGAGRASLRAGAYPEAARALERALGIWDAVPEARRPSELDQVDLLEKASLARVLSGDLAVARDLARRAVELVDRGAQPVRCATLLERLGRIHWLTGDIARAMEALDEGMALLAGAEPSPDAASVAAGYAGLLMLQGSHGRAVVAATSALEMARAAGDPVSEASALNALGVSQALLGDCAAGVASARRALELARTLPHPHERGRAYSNLASALQMCGRVEESLAVSLEGAAWSRPLGLWRTYGVFHEANAASSMVELGRWAEARAHLDAAEAVGGEGVIRLVWSTNAGPLAVLEGRFAEAHAILGEARDALGRLADAQFTGPTFHALAELALLERRMEDAGQLVEEGLGRVSDRDDLPMVCLLLGDAVRIAAERAEIAAARRDEAGRRAAEANARAHLERLRSLVAGLGDSGLALEPGAHLAEAEAEAARAAGAPDPEAWARAARAWGELGRPYRRAWARYREAEAILAAGGSRRDAAERLAEARATAGRLGARPLLDLVDGLARRSRLDATPATTPRAARAARSGAAAGAGAAAAPPPAQASPGGKDPFGLSAREREVLALLARGHTNRRIGQELFISESTAGVHVSNILGKLGVASRVEAAAVAARLGLDDAPGGATG